MSTIFDLLYREYCRTCLAEMRKQLLIPVANDQILEAPYDDGDPSEPADHSSGWGDGAATKEATSIR
ncbi:hypothetical protein [Bradyrhizobium iriomotense]|uniref:Uncharacterized protein n=1 Tax=Bradyrhizobium iriomotense TaxID=441950 RepID=A0ABQ6B9A8_9BRAD|nr:hypothetical protein [Bradyrhizobium iriomotense]GLR90957.1 hypothetical protein GCM10007857_76730 [Bradyrhizobium iriomotense]